MSRRALIHCNAGVEYGMGHAMRSVGLVQAASAEGWDVTIGGDLSAAARDVLQALLPSTAIVASSGADPDEWLMGVAEDLSPDVLHVDSYRLDRRSIPDDVPIVSNMQDGSFGVRTADLCIDGNHGAEGWFAPADRDCASIVGAPGAVIREQVRRHRGASRARRAVPRVLIVIGGTDTAGLTLRCLDAVLTIGAPIEVTVICRPDQLSAARGLAADSRHRVDVHGFVEDLPGLASEHDLIVSAAGTSVWDFACMGIPMALICAASNQRAGYDAMVASGLVIALGDAPYPDLASRMRAVEDLLASTPALEDLRRRLMALVDGRGAWRIVASWSQLLEVPRIRRPEPRLRARPAMTTDAPLLFDWRNDPQTRAASRTAGPLPWERHLRWVEATIEDPLRQLLVIEDETGDPIGTVRWDQEDAGWEVSITVAPHLRGRGLGSAILAAGEQALVDPHAGRLLAAVHRDNEASRRLFARAGYLPHLPADDNGFAVYAKWRFAA